jgi:NAD(P)-dependent dehydrogenase (short-subunit alcohol dehydrogenase family)
VATRAPLDLPVIGLTPESSFARSGDAELALWQIGAMAPRAFLVTGASTGIGEATALHLDQLGYAVFAGVRRDVDAEKLRAQASTRLTTVSLDVTDEAQVKAAAATIDAAVGERGLGGVVNNAGVARGGPLEYLPLDEWRTQLEINVIGQVSVTKAMLPLVRRDRGRIVFIGSVSGRFGTPLMGPYAASKFAVEGLAEALRHELYGWGIHVAVVEPGAVKTDIWEKGRETAARLESDLPPEGQERYARQIAAIKKGIEQQDSNGVPPLKVAKAVEYALLSRHPRDRYLVGTDAQVVGVLSRLAPDKVKDLIVRTLARP